MINDFYDSTAVINKTVTSQTAMGGMKKNYEQRIGSLLCRMSAKSVIEGDELGKMTLREVNRLYCEASTTNKAIIESDRVVIGGRTYEVTGIANPGLQDHHLEIDLSEIR